jgi:hypothetical protein
MKEMEDPKTGKTYMKNVGWDKKVHRYAQGKDEYKRPSLFNDWEPEE